MAKHFTIEIRVAYDVAHPIPSIENLQEACNTAINMGMLQNAAGTAVIEQHSVNARQGSFNPALAAAAKATVIHGLPQADLVCDMCDQQASSAYYNLGDPCEQCEMGGELVFPHQAT